MASTSQTPEVGDGALSTLNGFIQVLDIAKDACGIFPAQIAFSSASALLTTIRDTMANRQDFVELGQCCADVCEVLDRGLNGKQVDELSQSVLKAIDHFTKTMATVRSKIIKEAERGAVSRFFRSKVHKDKIAGWNQDFLRILHIFSTELVINAVVMISDLHRDRKGAPNPDLSAQASIPLGESPPPAPRLFFGRDEFIEKVIGFAEKLDPIALIGGGGIGKTSIALSVLHHSRIEKQFGDHRRFIRCDHFPASRDHFLARLSKVIGAGVENPEDLAPLRPLLSSKKMLIILDNAESVLDPQGTDAREIYDIVNELCQFKTICICITSRITTVPQICARPGIPALSMDAACDIFYRIYGDHCGRSDIINNLLQRLDFHALSITLLATTASHNGWSYDRLAEEWETSRAQILRTDYNESLAATIELSLNSPTFRKLGPTACDLLGVVAFFPRGVAEKSLNWFFPAIPDRKNIFDKFSLLSLTYRSNNFITMLAPIRDYLCPQDPRSSPLLCAIKDCYFTRLSVKLYPGGPGYDEAQWITSEDVNVEHLLNVFTPIDTTPTDIWDACAYFFDHLYWHKPRQTVLTRRIEALPDDHPSKPQCLFCLSRVFHRLGSRMVRKKLLTQALKLERQRGNDAGVAQALNHLSDANRILELYEEGIEQMEEALEIYKRLGKTTDEEHCWVDLAFLLFEAGKLDAAEERASHALNLIPEKGEEFPACKLHRVLGIIYSGKGEKERGVRHYETSIQIATPFHWHVELFWTHFALARMFSDDAEFSKANHHIDQAKLHAVDDEYLLARAMQVRAQILHPQHRYEDAIPEATRALEIFEKLGATKDVERCNTVLGWFKDE